jgi:hypothetical protein
MNSLFKYPEIKSLYEDILDGGDPSICPPEIELTHADSVVKYAVREMLGIFKVDPSEQSLVQLINNELILRALDNDTELFVDNDEDYFID